MFQYMMADCAKSSGSVSQPGYDVRCCYLRGEALTPRGAEHTTTHSAEHTTTHSAEHTTTHSADHCTVLLCCTLLTSLNCTTHVSHCTLHQRTSWGRNRDRDRGWDKDWSRSFLVLMIGPDDWSQSRSQSFLVPMIGTGPGHL